MKFTLNSRGNSRFFNALSVTYLVNLSGE